MAAALELWDIQGNILHSFGRNHAAHFLVHLESRDDGVALLESVVPDVTPDHQARPDPGVNLWLTYSGLELLGVRPNLLREFPDEFKKPVAERAEALGDVEESRPEKWQHDLGSGHWHLIVAVHADEDTAQVTQAWQARLEQWGAVWVQETATLPHMVEHFGFADGASQPSVEGVPHGPSVRGGGVPLRNEGWRPIKAGEFILGYPNEDGQVLPKNSAWLMRNGTYVVWRKLAQDVPAFDEALAAAADRTGLNREVVAAKIVGRYRDGVPIELVPDREPGDLRNSVASDPPNDFRYLPHDADGHTCPVGAHIRRTNPRDSFKFGKQPKDTGDLTARHRIIRRGMPYDDETGQGLLFVCYNADFERQFEVIQRAWCMDGDAFYLGEDQDFLLANEGASGRMTIPVAGAAPKFIETRPNLVVTKGMEYLFAPGIEALTKLANGAFS